VFLACAVIVALWLTASGSSAWRRWPLALLAVVFLIPDTGYFNQQLGEPMFFTTSMYRHYLRPGEIVLPIPYGTAGSGLLWQASAHMYFRMASGNFYLPADYGVQPFAQEATTGATVTPTRQAVAGLRSFVAERHVQAIAVAADDTQNWPAVIQRLGYPGVDVGGVLLYRVPPR